MTKFAAVLLASLLLPITFAAPAPQLLPITFSAPASQQPTPQQSSSAPASQASCGGAGGGGGGFFGGGGGGGPSGCTSTTSAVPTTSAVARARARARRGQMTMSQVHNTKGLSDYGLDFTICPDVGSATFQSSRVSSISSTLSCTYSTRSTGFLCTYDPYSGKLEPASPAECEGSRSRYADIGTSSYTSCPKYTGASLSSIETIAQASGDSVLCLYDTGAQCSYDTAGGDLLSGPRDSADCAPENSRDVALRPASDNKVAFLSSYVPKRSIANLQQKAKALRSKVQKMQKKLV